MHFTNDIEDEYLGSGKYFGIALESMVKNLTNVRSLNSASHEKSSVFVRNRSSHMNSSMMVCV